MANLSDLDKIQLLKKTSTGKFYYVDANGKYVEFVQGGGSSGTSIYPEGTLYYFALLSQIGTNAPTATVVNTNLPDGSITYGYTGAGNYTIISSGLFTVGKTFYLIQATGVNIIGLQTTLDPTNSIRLRSTATNSFTPANSVISNIPFQLIIFP